MKPASNSFRVLSSLPILCATMLMTVVSGVFAQTTPPIDPRVDELQKQMRDLDAKMNRVLGLLESKLQTTQPSMAPGVASAAALGTSTLATSKSKKPGANLEFWLMDGVSRDLPTSPALVRLNDTTQPFGFGNCLEQPDIAAYKQKYLGFRWSGLVHVEETGQHLVVLDFKTGDPGPYSNVPRVAVNTKFTMNGTELLNGAVNLTGKNSIETKTITMDHLETGYYEFSFWAAPTIFSSGDSVHYSTMSVTLKMKGPNDSAPVVINADRISHYE